MDTKYGVVACIPARGGSKSIPMKNIKPFAGKPLLHWVLEAVLGCSFIDRIYIPTDSQAIMECVLRIPDERICPITRSPETATDTASTESVLLELAQKIAFDKVLLLQATSPTIRTSDLEAAWEEYVTGRYDSMLSVARQKRFIWNISKDGYAISSNYDPVRRPRRQEFEGFLVENGAFYITSREFLLASKCRISGRIGLFEMPEETYFELDEPSDWIIMEGLLKNRKRFPSIEEKLKSVKALVMDVDGVLTDAGMYYSEAGDELKKFNTRDGKGLELIRHEGVRTAIITSENTEIVRRRAEKLKIDYVYQDISSKAATLQQLAHEMRLSLSEMAYIGDDINDIPAIEIAGASFCPADAMDDVKQKVDVVLSSPGGNGAVREACELLRAVLKEG